jgi:hypothetical protein
LLRNTPRPPVEVAVLLARLADGRRVDHRCHLLDVVEQQAVEERLVAILERRQEDVALNVVARRQVVLVGALLLCLRRGDLWRQEPFQAEHRPLVEREAGPLVEDRVRLEGGSSTRHRQIALLGLRVDARFEGPHVRQPPVRRKPRNLTTTAPRPDARFGSSQSEYRC